MRRRRGGGGARTHALLFTMRRERKGRAAWRRHGADTVQDVELGRTSGVGRARSNMTHADATELGERLPTFRLL